MGIKGLHGRSPWVSEGNWPILSHTHAHTHTHTYALTLLKTAVIGIGAVGFYTIVLQHSS